MSLCGRCVRIRAMTRLLLCALPLALAFPVPPEQTDEQTSIFQSASRAAQAASDVATPKVLAFFDSAEFRAELQSCCPEAARQSSAELLRRYRAAAQVAELSHALPAHALADWPFTDITEKQVEKLAWFPNEFQAALLLNKSTAQGAGMINDLAQKELFGCQPFAHAEPTWSEASSRLIYIAHNMRRLDTGSMPFFGDMTVVFNSGRLNKAVLIAPYDTGLFTMDCLLDKKPHQFKPPPLNCSAWPRDVPVGTLEHLDHLIIPNFEVPYNHSATNKTRMDGVRVLFSRGLSKVAYKDVPGLTYGDMGTYLESNILANPSLPHAVKLVIGNFPMLFGTASGQELQLMARRKGWPLFWAFGSGLTTQDKSSSPWTENTTFKSNLRIADPRNIAELTNASVPKGAEFFFDTVWDQAVLLRLRPR
ncbi:unnamed protein product, partial [Effrenium voratum]